MAAISNLILGRSANRFQVRRLILNARTEASRFPPRELAF